MRDPITFIAAVIKHWGVIVTGGAIIGGIGLWQSTGHLVAPLVYWSVAAFGLMLAFYKAWLSEHEQVLDLTAQLGGERAKLKQESEHSAELHKEIGRLKEQFDDQDKKDLTKVITLLHAMQSNVMYWKDIVKDKWGMAPSSVKLLPDDWPVIVYCADKISGELRKRVDLLEGLLVRANGLITQYLNMQVNFRDQRLMPLAYAILDQAAPHLFSVVAEFEGFESALRSRAHRQ